MFLNMKKAAEIFYYFLYFILNFLCYILVIISKFKSIISFSISYHLSQIFSSCLSLLFIYLTRNKPGYIETFKERNTEIVNKKDSNNETNIIMNMELSPITFYNLMPCNGCSKCKIIKLPLRSHHCTKCQKCVKGFDHHCWVLAGCIGENNRFKFIIFLLFQNISLIYGAIGISNIINNIQGKEDLEYFLIFSLSIICLFEIIFFWVFIYHIYLLITNQSTFEIFNEDQCPYLAIFKLERNKILAQRGITIINGSKIRPFDVGIINNVLLFLNKAFNSEKEINWETIFYANIKTNKIKLNLGDKRIQN